MSEYWYSFPNLGITFNMNPVAFTLGSFDIKWSLIFAVIAVMIGFYLYFKAVSKQKLEKKPTAFITAVTVFFALVGARLVFIIPANLAAMDQMYYESGNYPDSGFYNTFFKMIAFFDGTYGGMNLFGGLIFGLIALAIICKMLKSPLPKYLDSIVYALPASIAVYSLGYITDQTSFGRHTNSLLAVNSAVIEKWVDVMRLNDIARGGAAIGPNVKWIVGNPVAPTPVYEILGCIAVILIVYLISKYMLFIGEKFLWSLGLYSLVRAFTENTRIDAALFWNMRINVMFSVIAVLVCAILITVIRWQVREGKLNHISLYVDPRKNNGFENDTFVQKVYKHEVDAAPDETVAEGPGEADTVSGDTGNSTLGEADSLSRQPSPEPETPEGKGQVWTADDPGGNDEKSETDSK
ncbi:MAG TPA: prolipoprotein diacylglyceryl transferase [Oscillospiraceae bacterium]|nr:prolipoprotein diacylglyceryl transferase [Oscillospiraceae bacterium]HPS33662.1 prolipoprotein diacylglyceryl transferase [Oscillospiraceae bacterium]